MRMAVALLAFAASGLPAWAQTLTGPPDYRMDVGEEFRLAGQNPAEGEIRLGDIPIVLEKTPLADVAAKIGAQISKRGDAGEALDWVCVRSGTDWVWLTSDEIGGGLVNGVVSARLQPGDRADPTCKAVSPVTVKLELPLGMKVGMYDNQLRSNFGRPTWRDEEAGLLGFVYAHPLPNDGTLTASVWARVEAEGEVVALQLGQMSTF